MKKGKKKKVKKSKKKRVKRSGKDLCISLEALSRRIHLPRWATPRKVKIRLGGFRLITFCVFQWRKNQHTLIKS